MAADNKKIFLLCLLIVCAAIGAYSNTFHVPFQYDDILLVERNPMVHSLDFVVHPSSAQQFADYGLARRRIVAFASFALSYWANGTDVTGYHAVNISIHLINSLLVFLLVRLLLQTPKLSGASTGRQQLIPFSVALVFALHPVQTEAITYIYQRVASLVTLFYLAGVISYLKFRLVPENRKNRTAVRAMYFVMTLVFVSLAVSTKENALTLPFAVLVLEALLFTGRLKNRAVWIALVFVPLSLYVISLQKTGLSITDILFGADAKKATAVVRSSFDADYLNPGERRYEYLVTQVRVLLTYFRLLLLPVNQSAYYDYPVYRSLLAPQVLISLLVHISVFTVAAMAYVRSRTGPPLWRLVTVGILWFYITVALESSVIPLPLMLCEYRLYLPGIGLFLSFAATIAIMTNGHRAIKRRAVLAGFLVLAALTLATATYERNKVWGSQASLWSDVIRKAPRDEKGYVNTGSAYIMDGDMSKALPMYLSAYRLNPMNASTNYNLGIIYRSNGDVPKAIEHYRLALKVKPNYANALFNLGNAYMTLDREDEAIEIYEKLLALYPYLADAHANLSVAYRKHGDEQKARLHAEMARQLKRREK